MKTFKIYDIQDSFISKTLVDNNYSSEEYLLCGKRNAEEFRTIVKFPLDRIEKFFAIKDNVCKVELCMHLAEIKVQNLKEQYMINVGVNLHDFNINKVTYKSSPQFYQVPSMYIIKKEYKDKFINLDITDIVKGWIKDKSTNMGLTLIGLNENGFVLFDSSRNKNKMYIKVIYKEEIIEDEQKFSASKDNSNIRIKSYGFFINNTGNFTTDDDFNIVMWNKGNYLKNIEVDKSCKSIIVRNKGIYQIDYSLNVRCNELTVMSLRVNNSEIMDSRIQIGREEHISHGSILIGVSKEDTHIELVIKKTDMILTNIGIAASIRIVRV